MKERILVRFQEQEITEATRKYQRKKPTRELPKSLHLKALKKAQNRFRRLEREMEGSHDGSSD